MAHLDLTLERGSELPLGTQLAWKLRAAIAAGTLRPGERLPAVRELAVAAGVNVNTARAVYARLAEQGAIVSEHGRGTFVRSSPGRGAGLAELVERVAREARSHDVEPRELAALLYAGFDEPAGPALDSEDAAGRRAIRAEIEVLEEQLATLEPLPPDRAAERDDAPFPPTAGARLLPLRELQAVRDDLSERVAELRRERRAARVAARTKALAPRTADERAAWPELLALRPAV